MIAMLKHTRAAIVSILVASSLAMGGRRSATDDSKLPDPATAGFAEKLYRLDCGHSLANDESVWTPGENVGRNIEFSSTCWLIKHGSEWLLWDTGVPESAVNDLSFPIRRDSRGEAESAHHPMRCLRSSTFLQPS